MGKADSKNTTHEQAAGQNLKTDGAPRQVADSRKDGGPFQAVASNDFTSVVANHLVSELVGVENTPPEAVAVLQKLVRNRGTADSMCLLLAQVLDKKATMAGLTSAGSASIDRALSQSLRMGNAFADRHPTVAASAHGCVNAPTSQSTTSPPAPQVSRPAWGGGSSQQQQAGTPSISPFKKQDVNANKQRASQETAASPQNLELLRIPGSKTRKVKYVTAAQAAIVQSAMKNNEIDTRGKDAAEVAFELAADNAQSLGIQPFIITVAEFGAFYWTLQQKLHPGDKSRRREKKDKAPMGPMVALGPKPFEGKVSSKKPIHVPPPPLRTPKGLPPVSPKPVQSQQSPSAAPSQQQQQQQTTQQQQQQSPSPAPPQQQQQQTQQQQSPPPATPQQQQQQQSPNPHQPESPQQQQETQGSEVLLSPLEEDEDEDNEAKSEYTPKKDKPVLSQGTLDNSAFKPEKLIRLSRKAREAKITLTAKTPTKSDTAMRQRSASLTVKVPRRSNSNSDSGPRRTIVKQLFPQHRLMRGEFMEGKKPKNALTISLSNANVTVKHHKTANLRRTDSECHIITAVQVLMAVGAEFTQLNDSTFQANILKWKLPPNRAHNVFTSIETIAAREGFGSLFRKQTYTKRKTGALTTPSSVMHIFPGHENDSLDKFCCPAPQPDETGEYILIEHPGELIYRTEPTIDGIIAIIIRHDGRVGHYSVLRRNGDKGWLCCDDDRVEQVDISKFDLSRAIGTVVQAAPYTNQKKFDELMQIRQTPNADRHELTDSQCDALRGGDAGGTGDFPFPETGDDFDLQQTIEARRCSQPGGAGGPTSATRAPSDKHRAAAAEKMTAQATRQARSGLMRCEFKDSEKPKDALSITINGSGSDAVTIHAQPTNGLKHTHSECHSIIGLQLLKCVGVDLGHINNSNFHEQLRKWDVPFNLPQNIFQSMEKIVAGEGLDISKYFRKQSYTKLRTGKLIVPTSFAHVMPGHDNRSLDDFCCPDAQPGEVGENILIEHAGDIIYRSSPTIDGVKAIVLLHEGHYTALVRGENSEWFCCDNDRIESVDISNFDLSFAIGTIVQASLYTNQEKFDKLMQIRQTPDVNRQEITVEQYDTDTDDFPFPKTGLDFDLQQTIDARRFFDPTGAGGSKPIVATTIHFGNCGGAGSNTHFIQQDVNDFHKAGRALPPVLAYCEIKEKSETINPNIIIPAEYVVVKYFPLGIRNQRAAGGILILRLRDAVVTIREDDNIDGLEYVSLTVNDFKITAGYWCPPNSVRDTAAARQRFAELLKREDLVIGDFNGRTCDWCLKMHKALDTSDKSNSRGRFIRSECEKLDLIIFPSRPSVSRPKSGTCPEMAIVNPLIPGGADNTCWTFGDRVISDHLAITVTVGCPDRFKLPELTSKQYRAAMWAVSKGDYKTFRRVLNDCLSRGHRRPAAEPPPDDGGPSSPDTSVASCGTAPTKLPRERMSLDAQASLLTEYLFVAMKASIQRGTRRSYRPFWSSKLQRKADEVAKLFETASSTSNEADRAAAQAADAELSKAYAEVMEDSLPRRMKNVASSTDAWALFKGLAAVKPTPTSFKHDGKTIDDAKEQTTVLGKLLADLCRIRECSEQLDRPSLPCRTADERKSCKVTHDEVLAGFCEIKPKSSCGPDGIPARVLFEARLVPAFIHAVARLFSGILWQSRLPILWLKVQITAIIKASKDGSDSSHFRPIGLSVCLCKVLEWVVDHRLQKFIVPPPHQYGFTVHKSSEHVVATLVADICGSFKQKFRGPSGKARGFALALFVDAAAAFCSINPDKFITLLLEHGVPMPLVRFFQAFLTGRSQQLVWRGFYDKWRKTPWGGAQGLQSMPDIWRIFFTDLLNKFPRLAPFFDPRTPQAQRSRLKWACLADDLTLWACQGSYKECHALLREAAAAVTLWSNQVGVEVSIKSKVMPFYGTAAVTLPTQNDAPPLRLGQHMLNCHVVTTVAEGGVVTDEQRQLESNSQVALLQRLLGLLLDPRLKFHEHVNNLVNIINECVKLFKFMRPMKLQFKRSILFGAVISRVLYGSPAYWERITKGDRDRIIRAVAACARAACGALPGTSPAVAMSECGLDDLPTIVNRHITRFVETSLRLPAECQIVEILRSNKSPMFKKFVFELNELREPLLLQPEWDSLMAVPLVQFYVQSFLGLTADAPAWLRRASNSQLILFLAPDMIGVCDGSLVTATDTSAGASLLWVRFNVEDLNGASFSKYKSAQKPTPFVDTPIGVRETTSLEDQKKANTFRSLEPDYSVVKGTGPMASSYRPEAIALHELIKLLKPAVEEMRAERKAKGITAKIRILCLTDSMSNLDELKVGPIRQRSYRGAVIWAAIRALELGDDCELILAYVHSHCNWFIHDLCDHRAKAGAKSKPPLEPVTSVWHKDASRERAKLVAKASHKKHKKSFHDTIIRERAPWRLSNMLCPRDQRLLTQLRTDAVHGLGQLYRPSSKKRQKCPWCGELKGCHMAHVLGPCPELTLAFRKYPRLTVVLERGTQGLVSHPCETVLFFRVALHILGMPRCVWGSANFVDDAIVKPFRDFYERLEAEEEKKAQKLRETEEKYRRAC